MDSNNNEGNFEKALQQEGVYKVEATVQVGFSIQAPDGSWVKKDVNMKAHIGPGYPSREFLVATMKQMNSDCEAVCDEEIDQIATNIAQQSIAKQQQAMMQR